MPQDQGKNGFNLKDILLPKKEERSPASATRINAGVLLEQEQTAELPKEKAAPIAPAQAVQGPVDSAVVTPLETYQSDMDTVITQKNLSAVSIAAAEAERSASTFATLAPKSNSSLLVNIGLVLAGGVLFAGAAGVLGFVFLRQTPTITAPQAATSPFLAVDDTQVLVLAPEQLNRGTIMQNLEDIKEKSQLPLGLIGRIYVVSGIATSSEKQLAPALDIQTLLHIISPNAPDTLLRTLDPSYYLLALHKYDENQALLIMKTDSYEQAFSGMLAWEVTMPQELSPLFERNSGIEITDSSEANASTTTTTPISNTQFHDQIVLNHDARVITDASGNIVLLWTFLDRNTLVITTNEWTLGEIINRKNTFSSGN